LLRGRQFSNDRDSLGRRYRSVVDAVRFAVEVQTAMIERNAGVPEDTRIQFRVGIHLGDVAEESDGDLMGDGVNPPPGWCAFASVCLSEQAY
jgi:adenylate cyclase